MKRNSPVYSLSLCLLTTLASVAQETAVREIQYHGIRPADPGGRDGLRNPERGLRTEAVIGELPGSDFYREIAHLRGRLPSCYTDSWWLMDAQHYEAFGLTLVQAYCYLDAYIGKPIAEDKLAALQRSLEVMREAGLKAVLRFAYEKSMEEKAGPTVDDILRHLDQLAPLIRRNSDVTYVMQAGCVGAWGEWHSSANRLEQDHQNLSVIMAKILEILPQDRMTQVRVPKYKRWTLEASPLDAFQTLNSETAFSGIPAARIGFHNDGFLAFNTCGGTWTEGPQFSNPGNPEFDYMTTESPYLAVDGELFWSDLGNPVDGLRATVRMRLHHYSSFSIAHSYSEMEGKPFSIDAWMKTPITIEQVTDADLPVSDGYFQDSDGNPAERTQFEYIRDHLGYRIEIQRARFPEIVPAGKTFTVEIDLINRGFSTLINPRPVRLVLIDLKGDVQANQETDASPREWQPFRPDDPGYAPLTHTIRFQIELPKDLPPGSYMLGLWMPDAAEGLRKDARYSVRVANRDVPWHIGAGNVQGVNILGTVAVAKE